MNILYYYSREGCHLCDMALEALLPLLRGRVEIEVRDVDSCEEWRQVYNDRVPVIEYQGTAIAEYPFDHAAISQLLSEMPENKAEIGILRR